VCVCVSHLLLYVCVCMSSFFFCSSCASASASRAAEQQQQSGGRRWSSGGDLWASPLPWSSPHPSRHQPKRTQPTHTHTRRTATAAETANSSAPLAVAATRRMNAQQRRKGGGNDVTAPDRPALRPELPLALPRSTRTQPGEGDKRNKQSYDWWIQQ
jgi:hypothetical protein